MTDEEKKQFSVITIKALSALLFFGLFTMHKEEFVQGYAKLGKWNVGFFLLLLMLCLIRAAVPSTILTAVCAGYSVGMCILIFIEIAVCLQHKTLDQNQPFRSLFNHFFTILSPQN